MWKLKKKKRLELGSEKRPVWEAQVEKKGTVYG